MLYIVKKKCLNLNLRKTPTQNYDVPEAITIGSRYETLHRKQTPDETNPATEYMDISAVSTEYINLN